MLSISTCMRIWVQKQYHTNEEKYSMNVLFVIQSVVLIYFAWGI